MLKSFDISEPEGSRFASKWPEALLVDGTPPIAPLTVILRVLSGNVDLLHKASGKRRKCRTLYFSDDPNLKTRSPSYPSLVASWMAEEITQDDVIRYLKHSKTVNRTFYLKTAAEVCFCINAIETNNYTSAFVSIYRLLEWISVAFPNIYFSSSEDFVGVYEQLKKMLQDNANGGELQFFKKTLALLFDGDIILEYNFDFTVSSTDEDVCKSLTSQLKAVMDSANINIAVNENQNAFALNFKEIPGFIINLRNRYFHYDSSGKKNVDVDNVRDVELMFETVVEPCLRWFALVLLKVVARSVGHHAALVKAAATAID